MRREDPLDRPAGPTPGMSRRTTRPPRKRIAINVSLLWLLFPLTDLAAAGAPPARSRSSCAGARVHRDLQRDALRAGAARATATVCAQLAVLPRSRSADARRSRGLGDALPLRGIAGAMRLPRRDARAGSSSARRSRVDAEPRRPTPTPARRSRSPRRRSAIGFMMFAFRRLMRLNAELRDAREDSRGSPSPRSACASRASCTTCSATASRSSR